jgi:hypothetical protein
MGVEPLLYDDKNNVILSQKNWHKTARIEHRLGASSEHYNPYLNVVFALLNVIDAIDDVNISITQQNKDYGQLPRSLYDMPNHLGAISLFENNDWFSRSIDQALSATSFNMENTTGYTAGQLLQRQYLMLFQTPSIVT